MAHRHAQERKTTPAGRSGGSEGLRGRQDESQEVFPWAADDQLLHAVERGTIEEVQQALDAGADPNVRDLQGVRVLAIAARHATQTGACRLLLTAGAQIRAWNVGLSPLCIAAVRQDVETTDLLLAAGAEVNDPLDPWPALSLAVDEDGHAETAVCLALAGARIEDRSVQWQVGQYRACDAICRLVAEGALPPARITAFFSSADRRIREAALCALATAPEENRSTAPGRRQPVERRRGAGNI